MIWIAPSYEEKTNYVSVNLRFAWALRSCIDPYSCNVCIHWIIIHYVYAGPLPPIIANIQFWIIHISKYTHAVYVQVYNTDIYIYIYMCNHRYIETYIYIHILHVYVDSCMYRDVCMQYIYTYIHTRTKIQNYTNMSKHTV